jgi:hypothetical protein
MVSDGATVDKIELRGSMLYFTIVDPDGNRLTITGMLPDMGKKK